MIKRSFSKDDQIDFAKLSGDYNPIHLDIIKARRTCFGQPVVHGVHILLWALDNLVAEKLDYSKLTSLKTSFNRFIGVGEIVQFILKNKDETCAEIQLLSENEQVARILVTYSSLLSEKFSNFPNEHPNRTQCLDRSPQKLSRISGYLDLCLSQREAALLFPNLMRVFPSSQLAELITLTRLVGMECPGLHSIFSDLNLNFSKPSNDLAKLNYKVFSYDSRIRLLTQNVKSPGMTGTVRAFLRSPSQHQESYLELSKVVRKREFLGQTALIIGGSRGLGEVTGKLLAAGGARVVISYFLGSEEAHGIVKEIKQGGGDAICLPFDVLSPNLLRKEDFENGWVLTHLYYFATPTILLGSKHSFSTSLFQKFCNYYVSGFFNSFQTLKRLGSELQGIFYPSTIAVSDHPSNMAEYVAAKSSGEAICDLLRKDNPSMNIYSPRLPQTTTDQMAFFLPTLKQDPAPLMLENLRRFSDKNNIDSGSAS